MDQTFARTSSKHESLRNSSTVPPLPSIRDSLEWTSDHGKASQGRYAAHYRPAGVISLTNPIQIKNTDGITGEAARKLADSSKDKQDEYLEWSVERLHVRNASRDTGPIKRVVFTCEGPEVSRT